MLRTKPPRIVPVLLLLSFVSPAFTFLVTRAAEVDFQRDILPLLEEHCIDCHSEDFAESKLALDSPLAALRGGDSGERVIAPGDSAGSYLIERVTSENPELRMPPDADPLSAAQVQRLRSWIDETDWQQFARALLNTNEFVFIP